MAEDKGYETFEDLSEKVQGRVALAADLLIAVAPKRQQDAIKKEALVDKAVAHYHAHKRKYQQDIAYEGVLRNDKWLSSRWMTGPKIWPYIRDYLFNNRKKSLPWDSTGMWMSGEKTTAKRLHERNLRIDKRQCDRHSLNAIRYNKRSPGAQLQGIITQVMFLESGE